MSPGVVADLMAFAIDPPHEAGVVAGNLADHEKRALNVELFENVQDLRRPLRIRSVVEAQRNFVGVITVLLHRVGEWVRIHLFLGDHVVVQGNGCVVIHGDDAPAVLWFAGDAENVAFTLGIDVVAGLDLRQFLHRVRRHWVVPDLPHGVVFRSEHPQCIRLDAERSRCAHLVQDGDGVEKPHLVTDVRIFIVVGEVGIEGIVVELDLGLGV